MGQRLKKGDTVIVTSGKFKKKDGYTTATILEIEGDRVRLEGIEGGVVKRHLRPGVDPAQPAGGIIEKFPTVHQSNVMLVDPSSGKPTRVGFKRLKDGRKVRVATGSGEELS